MQRTHLVRYLDEIEGRGLVRRERDPVDRRRQRVALTRSGCELLRPLQEVAQRSQAEFLEVLSDPERETLIALLRRIVDADDARRATGALRQDQRVGSAARC